MLWHVTMIQLQMQDDGSCEYPAEGFDCAGNCLSGDQLQSICSTLTEMVVDQ